MCSFKESFKDLEAGSHQGYLRGEHSTKALVQTCPGKGIFLRKRRWLQWKRSGRLGHKGPESDGSHWKDVRRGQMCSAISAQAGESSRGEGGRLAQRLLHGNPTSKRSWWLGPE